MPVPPKKFCHPCLISAALLLLPLTACKQEQLEELTQKVKQATVNQVEKVVELPKSGVFEMQVDGAIKAEVGIVELINSGEGRGSVLQLRSYAAPESEKFPAIFFQGPTDATDTSALVGKTVTGKLFVQVGSSQPVWYCGDQQTVSCTFDSVEKTELVGKFTAGNLTSTDGRTSTISGSFRVVSGGSSSSSAGSSSGGTP